MIKHIERSNRDRENLEKIQVDPDIIKDDFFDYSRVVVRKPWGYEYLIFQNELVAIWILYIKKDAQTSMHCHTDKKTSLVVLEGEVVSSTLSEDFRRKAGEGLLIEKGVFHRTAAACESGAFVMEIESPVNKRDLVRIKDQYGREGKGYEAANHHSINTQNYNYISLNATEIQHNFKKRFGQCSLTFKKLKSSDDLQEILQLSPEDVISILNGQLLDGHGQPVIQIGDTMTIMDLQKVEGLRLGCNTGFLIVRKMDRIVKTSDYIAEFLHAQGLRTVFVVAGEANVHLLDSIGRKEGLRHVPLQKESNASLTAEAFGKLRADPAVLVVSSGAAAVNALPGVANAWVDSVPMLILSGQARTDQDFDGRVRQLGNKSLNVVDLVKSVTKYAVKVTEPSQIRYHLEKALYLAKEGRPGPVWIDLPIDVQGMVIDEDELKAFDPVELASSTPPDLGQSIAAVVALLKKSRRPVILAGSGIHNAGAESDFLKLVNQLGVPVLTSRRGADLIACDHPCYFGHPGPYGQRSANFVVQNCDLLISIGSRLSIPLIGRNTRSFARAAQKVVVDIDPCEVSKSTVHADLPLAMDAGVFIRELSSHLPAELPSPTTWIQRCIDWSRQFPAVSDKTPATSGGRVHALPLMRSLSQELGEADILIADGGPPLIYTLLAFQFKIGQRLVSSTGLELPGFALSGAIGATLACDGRRVVCLCEDRGVQIRMEELQTIRDYRLPIKILVLKSRGHSIIRTIQKDYFGGRFVGTDREIRLEAAPLGAIARAFGLPSFEVAQAGQMETVLREWLSTSGPALCEVALEDDQDSLPRPGFTIRDGQKWIAKPLEDMYPLLDREVLRKAMMVDLVEED